MICDIILICIKIGRILLNKLAYIIRKETVMDIKSNKCTGTVKISKDVIIDIAANVISEIDGISEYNEERLFKLGNKPAITVNFNNGAAEITVLLNVALECNVSRGEFRHRGLCGAKEDFHRNGGPRIAL